MKPAPGDHESDDENSFLLFTNLIPFLCIQSLIYSSGVLWLRDNKHLFKKTVHEPIMLAIDVKNRNFVKILEIHIGRADLEGFVCEVDKLFVF